MCADRVRRATAHSAGRADRAGHGSVGGNEAQLTFDDIRVEPWQLVGNLHDGFKTAIQGVSLGRIYNTARSVGLARWALEMALDYAGTRQAFGHARAPSARTSTDWSIAPRVPARPGH